MSSSRFGFSIEPSLPTPPHGIGSYPPSVPLSVYRELAHELQETQAQLAALRTQNQQLVQQNQTLKQAIAQVFQSTQALHSQVTTLPKLEGNPLPLGIATFTTASVEEFSTGEPELPPLHRDSEQPVIEEEQRRSHRVETDPGAGISSWLVLTAILLIVLTFSGLGFLAVRPLLNNR